MTLHKTGSSIIGSHQGLPSEDGQIIKKLTNLVRREKSNRLLLDRVKRTASDLFLNRINP